MGGFAKTAIFVKSHRIMTSKSYEKAMTSLQAKKWHTTYKIEYDNQIAQYTFTIILLFYNYKVIKKNRYSNSKKILIVLFKCIRPDALLKDINS